MPKIVFLGGPSGVGKSHFASKHLVSLGWRHFEIDQATKDGIDEHNLRREWDAFFERSEPTLLRQELTRRADRAPGIVLSFSSNLVFVQRHISAAASAFQIAYLFGHPAHCLTAFLERERWNGRGLDANHWDRNNALLFARLSRSIHHRFLVHAFHQDGSRRDPNAICDDLLRLQPDA